MELWCRIPREDMNNFSILTSEGYDPQLIKNGIEMKFPSLTEPYLIADFPEDTDYFLKLWEYGGGMTKTGSAYTVCGSTGQKLKPTKIFTTGHLANNIHAEFEEKYGYVINSSKNGIINITYLQLQFIHDSIQVAIKHTWNGVIELLPNRFTYLKKAVYTTFRKANDYHCRIPYYIQE
ncbi:hypothetical protein DRO91_08175 [Candidatus Heimdallarchaeota archaeon]|nr:MAG: hypothetical protein DRO91_08175 [Candidatus Heimdallarchaeota archaeon]